MCRSSIKVMRVPVFVGAVIALVLSGHAQTKKESLWDQIKNAAKQGAQQGQPQQQPTRQPAQRQDTRGHSGPQSQINESGPFKPPAGTKIQETVLAPLQEGAKFEVSPQGVHVATTETDGSRAVVYYDGVEGPKFDEIFTLSGNLNDTRITFSPDGNRYAYCARSGNQFIVMVDGKELVRSTETQVGKCAVGNYRLGFTSNSQHVYYFAEVHEIQPIDQTVSRFVFDGKPEMTNEHTHTNVTFSPDGNHYAYIWEDPDRRRPWMLIVDGKPAAYQAGTPQWTADSKHLYTQRQLAGTMELLFDAKPVARAFSFQVYIPPVGDQVVVVVTGGTNFHPVSFLVVNGKKVPGSDTVERGTIDKVVFSPDGKHYAAHCSDLSNHQYVISDGKRGQDYAAVNDMSFTPDSSTLVYTSFVNSKTFLVVGDKEFGAAMGSGGQPVFAPAGNRVGSFITINGTRSLVMDGKITPLNARGGSDLSFTPDGAHYAYFADQGNGFSLVIDGVSQAQSVLTRVDIVDLEHSATGLKYVFSPDSKHVAHFGDNTAGVVRGIFLDGKFFPLGPDGVNTKLGFSPDSKHLFWIHIYGNNPNRLLIDGKAVLDFYGAGQNLGAIPHWWEFGPDGALSFLTQDDNSLKRITITPSSETSLATMVGSAETVLASGH